MSSPDNPKQGHAASSFEVRVEGLGADVDSEAIASVLPTPNLASLELTCWILGTYSSTLERVRLFCGTHSTLSRLQGRLE